MSILDSVLLGIVEGITEFLPISSTGHLILASQLLAIPAGAFLKSFEIAIQLGAMCSVLLLYWSSFLDVAVLKRIAIAFVPTAVIGLVFYSFVKNYLLGNAYVVVGALAIGGIALIVFELWHKEKDGAIEKLEHVSYAQAFYIGLFQSVAIIPGVSRSAATIVGGLLLGIKRITIVEFSFLLAVPTMAAATGLDLIKSYSSFSTADVGVLGIGFVTAFLVALVSITFLLRYIKNHTFISFGVYRIIVALLFWILILSH